MAKETRRKYREESKREAVRLVVEEGRKVSEVPRTLGIGRSMLDRWRQQFGEARWGEQAGCRADTRTSAISARWSTRPKVWLHRVSVFT